MRTLDLVGLAGVDEVVVESGDLSVEDAILNVFGHDQFNVAQII